MVEVEFGIEVVVELKQTEVETMPIIIVPENVNIQMTAAKSLRYIVATLQ